MITLLYKTLKALNRLPGTDSGRILANFIDSGEVAEWSRQALAYLVEAGIVNGSGGKLLPADTTTRTEIAQVLYNLLSK